MFMESGQLEELRRQEGVLYGLVRETTVPIIILEEQWRLNAPDKEDDFFR